VGEYNRSFEKAKAAKSARECRQRRRDDLIKKNKRRKKGYICGCACDRFLGGKVQKRIDVSESCMNRSAKPTKST